MNGCEYILLQWDEALLTMTAGEHAEIVIQPEWAYGKKGLEGKYPFYTRCRHVSSLVIIWVPLDCLHGLSPGPFLWATHFLVFFSLFFLFLVRCTRLSWPPVGFWAHVNIASRIISYRWPLKETVFSPWWCGAEFLQTQFSHLTSNLSQLPTDNDLLYLLCGVVNRCVCLFVCLPLLLGWQLGHAARIYPCRWQSWGRGYGLHGRLSVCFSTQYLKNWCS